MSHLSCIGGDGSDSGKISIICISVVDSRTAGLSFVGDLMEQVSDAGSSRSLEVSRDRDRHRMCNWFWTTKFLFLNFA